MTLSPGIVLGTLIAGLLLQAALAFVASLIQGARMDERIRAANDVTRQQIAGIEKDVAEIKRKLGNGGEGVFLRTDLAKEIIAGLSNKDATAAATIAALQNDVATLKARALPDHHT